MHTISNERALAHWQVLNRLPVTALKDAPTLAHWKDAPLTFVAGNPRVAVGSMNGMRMELPLNTDRDGFRQIDDEDWINETVFLSLPETHPKDAFAKRLAAPHNSKSK